MRPCRISGESSGLAMDFGCLRNKVPVAWNLLPQEEIDDIIILNIFFRVETYFYLRGVPTHYWNFQINIMEFVFKLFSSQYYSFYVAQIIMMLQIENLWSELKNCSRIQ